MCRVSRKRTYRYFQSLWDAYQGCLLISAARVVSRYGPTVAVDCKQAAVYHIHCPEAVGSSDTPQLGHLWHQHRSSFAENPPKKTCM
jgi:hypothetical protein